MAAADQETHASPVRPRSYQDESYQRGFLGAVEGLQKDGILQDVVLEVEGRRFPCHRLVMAAASPYFRAMFTSDMAESRQKTVVLQGLDADMFEEILSYIYSGTLHVSLDRVQPLYQAADLLQLDYVRDTCSSYMAMNVERSTCVDLYKIAEVFMVDVILNRCLQYICQHFVEVSSSEEFCSLSVDQLTKIISQDKLEVKEETRVWEAVVRWVQHSRVDRLQHLPSILSHIRFNLLTSDDTAAILEHPLVRENHGSFGAIRNVVQTRNPNLKPRLGMTTEMVLLSNIETMEDELLFMNPQEGQYITSTEDIPDGTLVTVTRDNDIYGLVYGRGEESGQFSMCKYNHADNVWEGADMSSVARFKREYSGMFTHMEELLLEVDGILYYHAADLGEVSALVRMKKYDQRMDQWQECSQLLLDGQWDNSTAVSCGPYLYFLTNSAMYRYDPSQDCWCKRTPPNFRCHDDHDDRWVIAAAVGPEIFCTNFHFTKTKVYDTESDCWQELQSWTNPGYLAISHLPSFFILDNQLHIFLQTYDDYKQGPLYDYKVYVYDRSADAWRDLKATLPNVKKDYHTRVPVCPVARIYVPYLKGAQKHITCYGFKPC
ncbi:PREDICTED: kelch-like protein 12 [Branchiostoma belcheri]|uniref:Kelch-like protein 12 n=1 Tax=Branchiostoma belcheri TaxID=7741 RepID=A0A6P4ZG74_BRABE|nr:PREDICTED: kelch-like protein 12 [Branchiostoma belcheri]